MNKLLLGISFLAAFIAVTSNVSSDEPLFWVLNITWIVFLLLGLYLPKNNQNE